ncbi:MAG: 16S rRNA (guanine(966)-N(2))-methyltransferase RsmD [Acidobacteriota bacterium]
MRIIAGKFRGKKLLAPRGKVTRPTGAKVREALFDLLGGRIEGCLFVDLYAGSGAVGLEALSRGAESVVFSEQGAAAYALLRRNVDLFQAGDAVRAFKLPVRRALDMLETAGREPDVFFLDPPWADGVWEETLEALDRGPLLKRGAVVVVEHPSRRPVKAPPGLQLLKTRRYGDTSLTIMERP